MSDCPLPAGSTEIHGESYIEEYTSRRKVIILHRAGVIGWRELTHLKPDSHLPPLPEHMHIDQMEIIYVVNGAHHYFVDGAEQIVCGGEILIVFPKEMHSTNKQNIEKSDFYRLHIDIINNTSSFLGIADSQEARDLANFLSSMNSRHFVAHQKCKGILDELIRASHERPPLWRTHLRMLAFEFLCTLVNNENQSPRTVSKEIERALNFIEMNLFEPLDLCRVSDYVFLSLSHFKAKFKKEMGISPGEYVMRRKVKKACELLLGGSTITDTAYALSFSSSQYFARVFKQYNAVSPRQYVHQAQKSKPAESKKG